VNKVSMNYAVGVTVIKAIGDLPISVDPRLLIRDRHAQVERVVWGRAEAALPCEDSLLQPPGMGYAFKLKIG
jgi:hypothetical protein